jgi:hypothetical protein
MMFWHHTTKRPPGEWQKQMADACRRCAALAYLEGDDGHAKDLEARAQVFESYARREIREDREKRCGLPKPSFWSLD